MNACIDYERFCFKRVLVFLMCQVTTDDGLHIFVMVLFSTSFKNYATCFTKCRVFIID